MSQEGFLEERTFLFFKQALKQCLLNTNHCFKMLTHFNLKKSCDVGIITMTMTNEETRAQRG